MSWWPIAVGVLIVAALAFVVGRIVRAAGTALWIVLLGAPVAAFGAGTALAFAVAASSSPRVDPTMFRDLLADFKFASVVPADGTGAGSVVVRNISRRRWYTNGDPPVLLGYRWIDTRGHPVGEGRAQLGSDVKSGETRQVRFVAHAPALPDSYILSVDLIDEGVSWFSFYGNRPATVTVKVQ